jgi:lipopolysaccharide transport system ATP-binding protein
MMRDPRDQTVSRLFHIRRDKKRILEWHHRLREMSDDRALMACIEGSAGGLPGTIDMINLTKSWLREGDKSLCVRYESLKSNPVEEFKRVLGYLGFKIDDALIRAIVERNRFERLSVGRKFWKTARKPGQEDISSHVRKGVIGDWENYFKENHIQRNKELAGDAPNERGYEKDLIW